MSPIARFLRLLRDSWPWWVVPIVVMLALTLALSHCGDSRTVAPFDYGIHPGGGG